MLAYGAKSLLSSWLVPPVSLFLLAAAGLLLARRRPRTGRWLVALSLLAGVASSLPLFSQPLMAWVEAPYAQLDPPPLRLPQARQAQWRTKPDQAPQAIVVLAGGSLTDGAASSQPNRIGSMSLERALHASRVARLTGLPVLLSGGVTLHGGEPEARLMRSVLADDLATPVRWIETKSRDTGENAAFTRELLQPLGISRVLLVTHAFHMRRAQWTFEHAGFAVTPAPHAFLAGPARFSWLQLVPSLGAVTTSSLALHEIIGLGWYRFTGLFG